MFISPLFLSRSDLPSWLDLIHPPLSHPRPHPFPFLFSSGQCWQNVYILMIASICLYAVSDILRCGFSCRIVVPFPPSNSMVYPVVIPFWIPWSEGWPGDVGCCVSWVHTRFISAYRSATVRIPLFAVSQQLHVSHQQGGDVYIKVLQCARQKYILNWHL